MLEAEPNAHCEITPEGRELHGERQAAHAIGEPARTPQLERRLSQHDGAKITSGDDWRWMNAQQWIEFETSHPLAVKRLQHVASQAQFCGGEEGMLRHGSLGCSGAQ